jgi:RNA polymerase sigma factor (sigma-70 family)
MTHDAREDLARRAMEIALRTAAPMLGSREEAADVAQDVALDVLKALPKLREPEAFDAWTRRIAVRHTVRAIRARRLHPPSVPLESAHELERVDAPDADAVLASRRVLADALRSLPTRQALALVLRYVFDLTDREIAAALDCRRGTVNALLSRGRATLRETPELQELASMLETTP